MIEKILFVADGIIVITTESFEMRDIPKLSITLNVRDHGAELKISNAYFQLPVTVLDHLENAEGTNVYFYHSSPYALVAPFTGGIEISRDELLTVKGAWEYSQAPE